MSYQSITHHQQLLINPITTNNLRHSTKIRLEEWVEVDSNNHQDQGTNITNSSSLHLNSIHKWICLHKTIWCSHLLISVWDCHQSIMTCHHLLIMLNLISIFLTIMVKPIINQISIELKVAQWMILKQD